MKTLLAFFLVFSIGTSCMAQVDLDKDKHKNRKITKELVGKANETEKTSEQKLGRVYLYKNSRVKKELKFKTKKNKSKLA